MKKQQGTGSRLGSKTTIHKWAAHSLYKWRVSYVECGKHKRKGFKTKRAAEDWAEARKEEALQYGTADMLTASERAVVAEYRGTLAKLSTDLRSVLEVGIEAIQKRGNSISVAKAVEKFIELKKAAEKSERHSKTVSSLLNRFADDLGDSIVSDLVVEDLDEWLLGLKSKNTGKRISKTTWGNYRRHIGMLFNQCRRWGYCDSNPAKETQKPEKSDREPSILTPNQVGDLLTSASPEIQPAIALGLFAGLRVAEIQRLNWEEIDLENNLIKLVGAVTKKKFRRVIPVRPNLKAWLLLQRRAEGPVSPRGHLWRKHYNAARRAAGFDVMERNSKEVSQGMAWGNNAMRHSFASYGLQAEQDPGKITLELGHRGSTQTLYESYRATCTPEEAVEYWAVEPEA